MTFEVYPDLFRKDGTLSRYVQAWTALVLRADGTVARKIAGCGTKRQATTMARECIARLG